MPARPRVSSRQVAEALTAHRAWEDRRAALGSSDPLPPFLSWISQTIPFYAPHKEAIARSGLAELPLVDRPTVQAHPEAFTSIENVHPLYAATTSGTSGAPLTVVRDAAGWYSFAFGFFAEVAPFVPSLASGCEPGSTAVVNINDNPDRRPFVHLNPALGFARVVREIMSPDEAEEGRLARRLRRMGSIPLLTGRPRALRRLAEVDEALPGARIRAGAILASGDNLHTDDRRTIESAFGCKVHNGFGSQELGIVAVECQNGRGLHVLGSRARLEILDEYGALRSEGSGELVGTNLDNRTMAFVRYRTGDQARIAESRCACGFAGASITEITGRDSVYFEADGVRFNPSILNPVVEAFPLRQFQIVQESPGAFSVAWVPKPGTSGLEQVSRDLAHALRRRIGPAAEVEAHALPAIGAAGRKVQRYVVRRRERPEIA